jgi:hypothetical protein
MRYTLNQTPPTKARIFINSTMNWDDNDRTTWAESWNQDERDNYMLHLVTDYAHGITTASPSIFAMIQAVE